MSDLATVIPGGLPALDNVIVTFESVGCRYLVEQVLTDDAPLYRVWFVNAGGSTLERGDLTYIEAVNYVRDTVDAEIQAEG